LAAASCGAFKVSRSFFSSFIGMFLSC